MASNIVFDELSRRRWEQLDDPAAHKPETALAAAAEHIARDGADHVLVIIARKLGEGIGHRYLSAGSLDHFGQLGLLAATQALMLND